MLKINPFRHWTKHYYYSCKNCREHFEFNWLEHHKYNGPKGILCPYCRHPLTKVKTHE